MGYVRGGWFVVILTRMCCWLRQVRQGQNVQIVLEGTNEAADRKQRAAQTAASAKAGAEAARKVRHLVTCRSAIFRPCQFRFTESG